MTTVITAASITAPEPGDAAALPGRLAGRAAQNCMATAGVSPDAVGALVNVGVYRLANTFEPAVAALVQKEAGINLDYLAHPVPGAGFSFDLMNGACGVLNAVQVAQALLNTGSAERVLITAADVHPSGQAPQDGDYPYADLGAALLLERAADPGVGFGPVRLRTADGSPGVTGYLDSSAMGTEGRRQITVKRDADWVERLLDLTARLVTDYADEEELDLVRTLLVCSRPTPDFAARLATRLRLDPAAVCAPEAPDTDPGAAGEPHTAAPVLGYLKAVQGGLPNGYQRALFVSAGSGLSAACAGYRPQGR
ncbi:hypothetical protein [Streptomyces sp. KR80]|uniref:hypothetical protein n=1 Tax=Streptomyces sp. KR80 TaxID=3457426 RepID=UPI003FD1AFB7